MIETITWTWNPQCKLSRHPPEILSMVYYLQGMPRLIKISQERRWNIIFCKDSGKLLANYLLSASQPVLVKTKKILMTWTMYVNVVC